MTASSRPATRPPSAFSRWARRLGAAGVLLVGGAALTAPAPVGAQLPDLLPTTTAAPGATTTTLLPPLDVLTPLPTTAPGTPPPTLLPGPGSTPGPTLLPPPSPATPGPTLLPAPAPAPARTTRTTTFTTTPPPPRTALRTTVTTLQRSGPLPPAPPAADDVEGGDPDAGFQAALPFTPEDEQIRAAGLDVELGGAGSERSIGLLASVAAGLIAFVLLGVVSWVQAEVRRRSRIL